MPIIGMGVDAGAYRRSAEPDLAQQFRLLMNGFCRALDRRGVGAELLAQPHGDRILHVSASRLEYMMKLFALLCQCGDKVIERGVKFFELQQRRQTHGAREDIVSRLPIVDVVVGMNVLVLAERAAQQLGGAVGDDLVAIHVEADAGARLEDVHYEFVIPLALLNFLSGRNDRVGRLFVNQSQLAVSFGGRLLHHRDRADERAVGAQPADGKVLHRTRGLNSVVNVAGNFLVAERIFFRAGAGSCGGGHRVPSTQTDDSQTGRVAAIMTGHVTKTHQTGVVHFSPGAPAMATTQVSLDEYLRTDYEPDCDYVDGELEERNVGETEHSAVQAFFIKWLATHEEQWKLEAYPEIRMRVSPTRVRIADLAILPLQRNYEAVLTRPPVAVIEVLSPEDRVSRYQQRLDDYRAMGIANVWVIDPMRRKAFDCSQGGWQPVEKLLITNPPVEIPLNPLWKKLEELHS